MILDSISVTAARQIAAISTATGKNTLCKKALLNVAAGEIIRVAGWAIVDANSGLIGLTMGLGYIDAKSPAGFTGVRWPAPHVSKWSGGNVKRYDGEHHKSLDVEAYYRSPAAQKSVTFLLWLAVYSTAPAGLSATVQASTITFERHPSA